jgi:predicted ester cyclase
VGATVSEFEMRIVELIAEGDTVVCHFECSGTHPAAWLGVPATGRRFEQVDEIYIFRIRAGKAMRTRACVRGRGAGTGRGRARDGG